MEKKLLFLIIALPALVTAQTGYTVTRNYPNIDKPIQFHLAPQVDLYSFGGLLRVVADANVDIKNRLTLQAAIGTRAIQFGSYSYAKVVANSYEAEKFLSFSNFGLTWYFNEKISEKELNLAFSKVNKTYQDLKVPVMVSKSWGLRLGNTAFQQWWQLKSKYFYAINAEVKDTDYLTQGASFTYQNNSLIYAGIDYRKLMNSIYMVDGKRKVSVRSIMDYYLDVLYSTGISYNDIVTVSDSRVWQLHLWDENYHKVGFLLGASVRRPQGNGVIAKMELGMRPGKGPYFPGFISFTLGWGFGLKADGLTKKIPG
jgi:hypothetical protein